LAAPFVDYFEISHISEIGNRIADLWGEVGDFMEDVGSEFVDAWGDFTDSFIDAYNWFFSPSDSSYGNQLTAFLGTYIIIPLIGVERLAQPGGFGDDLLLTGLLVTEIVGYVDPTPVSDVLNAGLNTLDGNYGAASLSLGGAFIPGGFEKGAKAAAKIGGGVMGGASSALKSLTKNIDCASPNVINRTVGKALGKCFVAGTPVTVPTGGEGRWLVSGLGMLTAGVIACGIAHLPRKKREEEDRDALFADEQLDNWDDPLDNGWEADTDHWGKDFVDLKQDRLDALCDLLFHGDPVRQAFQPDTDAPLSLGAGLPLSSADVPRRTELHSVPSITSTATMPARLPQVAAKPKRPHGKRQRADNVRSWLGSATLLLCAVFAAFRFYKHAGDNDVGSLPIEQIHPAYKVIVDAPKEALATDFARLTDREINWNASNGGLEIEGVADPLRELTDASAEAIERADYRLLILQAKEVWDDGTCNEINVETLQPWQWIDEHQAHVGSWAPLPLDTLEMGLPEGMTGKVLDILPCPKIKSGRGRVVLTTVNRMAQGVLELTLRAANGQEETLRPTGEHLFYSVSHGEWLPADQLQPGEHLDGVNGTVTVTAITTLPGTHRVYNMTVQGEHLYRVANCGVLVHNNYLGNNLRKAGSYGDLGTDAHHIVSRGHKGATDARGVLKKHGIGIDDAANGAWLPRNSQVSRARGVLHNQAGSALTRSTYLDAVNDRILKADSGGRATVLRELQKIRYELLNGTFPGGLPNY